MTIDTKTNVRLVRSWRLLVQSSTKLKQCAQGVEFECNIGSREDGPAGFSIPEDLWSRWHSGSECWQPAPGPADRLEITCEALGSIERVLSRLSRVTREASGGLGSVGSRAAIEHDLGIIGACLRQIATAAQCYEAPLHLIDTIKVPEVPDVSSTTTQTEEDEVIVE